MATRQEARQKEAEAADFETAHRDTFSLNPPAALWGVWGPKVQSKIA
jgi:hypothetical protein